MEISVLVIDDSRLVIDLVNFALKPLGVTVFGAADGKEALRRMETKKFDLIITDLKMPGMDGIAFLQTVCISEKFSKIPVMVLTGFEEKQYQDAARAAGVTRFLHKPFTSQALMAAVCECLPLLSK